MKRNLLLKRLLICLMSLIFIACLNEKGDNSEKKEYQNYIENTIKLSKDTEVNVKIGEDLYVELEEKASTSYVWEATITDENLIEKIGENTFDFKDEDLVGGSVTKVWKFKVKSSGVTKINFVQRDISNLELEQYEYEFKINISDDLNTSFQNYINGLQELKEAQEKIIAIGETVYIQLEENASTGYMWTYNLEDGTIVEEVDKKSFSFVDEEIVGAGVTKVWKFEAKKLGTTKINFVYAREFEEEYAGNEELEYIIKVE